MIRPMIHLNGTAGPELEAQMRDVIEMVERCRAKLRRAYPHGRDYPDQAKLDAAQQVWLKHDRALTEIHMAWEKSLRVLIDSI